MTSPTELAARLRRGLADNSLSPETIAEAATVLEGPQYWVGVDLSSKTGSPAVAGVSRTDELAAELRGAKVLIERLRDMVLTLDPHFDRLGTKQMVSDSFHFERRVNALLGESPDVPCKINVVDLSKMDPDAWIDDFHRLSPGRSIASSIAASIREWFWPVKR